MIMSSVESNMKVKTVGSNFIRLSNDFIIRCDDVEFNESSVEFLKDGFSSGYFFLDDLTQNEINELRKLVKLKE